MRGNRATSLEPGWTSASVPPRPGRTAVAVGGVGRSTLLLWQVERTSPGGPTTRRRTPIRVDRVGARRVLRGHRRRVGRAATVRHRPGHGVPRIRPRRRAPTVPVQIPVRDRRSPGRHDGARDRSGRHVGERASIERGRSSRGHHRSAGVPAAASRARRRRAVRHDARSRRGPHLGQRIRRRRRGDSPDGRRHHPELPTSGGPDTTCPAAATDPTEPRQPQTIAADPWPPSGT